MPTTGCAGRPEYFCSAQTIASSGLVMQMTKAFGQCFLIPSPTDFMTFRLMPSRSSRLIPGLRGTPAVTMQTSAPAKDGIVVGARHLGVETVRRAGLRDVERLALRHALGDVEEHDVAEFLDGGEMGERAADLSRADQRNLGSGHGSVLRDRVALTPRWVVPWAARRKYAATRRGRPPVRPGVFALKPGADAALGGIADAPGDSRT